MSWSDLGVAAVAVVCFYLLWWCRSLACRLGHVERTSKTDPLTGLGSGPWLESERWPAALRSGHPLCVVYLDLDHLKARNDRQGHAVGDLYIQNAADALRQASRRGVDELFRVYTAGDEFKITPLVVVDHVGDLSRSLQQPDMRSATSTVFSGLKALALDQKIHVFAVSHVARAITADKENKPKSGRGYEGSAKDAGEVENDSATVLYLHTDPPGGDGIAPAELHIAKARGAAPNQTLRLRFDGAVGCFTPALDSELSADEQRVLEAVRELTQSGMRPVSLSAVKAAVSMGQARVNSLLTLLVRLKRIRRDSSGIHLTASESRP